MDREEAAEFLEREKGICEKMLSRMEKVGIKPNRGALDALAVALSALRPVSREQVEKVWRGEWELIGSGKNGRGGIWNCKRCEKSYPYKCDFCPCCGAAMTDEAVQMVMERLEAMQND